jgi:hypothetical protein
VTTLVGAAAEHHRRVCVERQRARKPSLLVEASLFAKQMVLGTANSTVEMAVGSQLSATVSEGDL